MDRSAEPLRTPLIGELLACVLGASPEAEFDAITATVASLSGCRLAFLSLIQGNRLWFKSASDGPIPPVDAERTFCAGILRSGESILVEDASQDKRFRKHPNVSTEPFIRSFAGVPLTVRGQVVGTLCVVDRTVSAFNQDLMDQLGGLGRVVEALIEARLTAAQAIAGAGELTLAMASRDRLHSQLQQAERIAGIGSWRLTVADRRLEYSDQVYAIHDLPVGELSALADALAFYPEPDRARIERAVRRTIKTGEPYDLELDFLTAKGRRRRVRAMARAEMERGRVVALVGVFQDVTERYERQQELERAANTDHLTEIGGRRGFTAQLDTGLLSNMHESIALILIDLDHFKIVNDRYGHGVGDDVLRRVAETLRAPWLQESYAARLGGDEFALVVTEERLLSDLDKLAQRLLSELIFTVGNGSGKLHVTATVGIVHCVKREASRRKLLETADAALYAAKATRRGTASIRRIGAAAARSA